MFQRQRMGDDDAREWARNGSFMKKPSSGWLHDDQALMNGDGVYYPVKYVASIGLTQSMRTMQFEERTAVTREAITLCCEMAGVRPPRKRKVSKIVRDSLVADPLLKNLNVKLTISTTGIALVIIETNQVIANHIMPCISFATGGDSNDYDMIGYVAKDARNVRECHVFDCGHMAHDVIATIGQAFELRFKSFLAKQSRGGPGLPGAVNHMYLQQAGLPQEDLYSEAPAGDRLYDDLPTGASGQEPLYDNKPQVSARPAFPMYGDGDQPVYDNKPLGASQFVNPAFQGKQEAVYDNRAGAPPAPFRAGAPPGRPGDASMYGALPGQAGYRPTEDYDDVMDDVPSASLMQAPGAHELDRPLHMEVWFHGQIGRDIADQLLFQEGQEGNFLVRESVQSRGQYVLSAIQQVPACRRGVRGAITDSLFAAPLLWYFMQGQPKHLLLVDPSGRVRTKDMMFNSVSHLVNYHIRARIPIISRGSRVTLGEPVARR
eukprot:m.58792 g.58792  ORF g.58792 m.58792 type:complete len:489 (-) comp49194_c0_seq1:121-1587(-)